MKFKCSFLWDNQTIWFHPKYEYALYIIYKRHIIDMKWYSFTPISKDLVV
jgi:hypothetical protein